MFSLYQFYLLTVLRACLRKKGPGYRPKLRGTVAIDHTNPAFFADMGNGIALMFEKSTKGDLVAFSYLVMKIT